jgi:hypothetical protein
VNKRIDPKKEFSGKADRSDPGDEGAGGAAQRTETSTQRIRHMTNELAGKVALVTGASKGIGAGIATAFAAAGASVAVGYARDHHGAERVASEIKAASGKAIALQGDLAKTADAEIMDGFYYQLLHLRSEPGSMKSTT